MIEEPDFPIDPTTISDEFATLSDHSMTRDEYHDWIIMIGSADGSDSFWMTDLCGLFLVVPRFSVGDCFESFP